MMFALVAMILWLLGARIFLSHLIISCHIKAIRVLHTNAIPYQKLFPCCFRYILSRAVDFIRLQLCKLRLNQKGSSDPFR